MTSEANNPDQRASVPWHALPTPDVLANLGSGEQGLSPDEAASRLIRLGSNELAQPKSVSRAKLLVAEFTNPLILILLASAALLLTVSVIDPESAQRTDGLLILGIVLANATLSFTQNYRANKGIEALGRVAAPFATVIRDGHQSSIEARELVPGDLVMLEEGDRIPADGRLLAVSRLQVDESALTGESIPVAKDPGLVPTKTDLAERTNSVYSGTTALSGRASYVVTQTGMESELGRIAQAVQAIEEGSTSFQREIAALGRRITLIVALLIAVIVPVQLGLVGQSLLETFVVAVALSVAAIPEGLPVVLTLALAFGTRRMLDRNALVASLPVVEIIGSAEIVCTDKTGTITEGRMSLRYVLVDDELMDVTGGATDVEGEFVAGARSVDLSDSMAMLAAGLCNNAHLNADGTFVGDPTEVALLAGAHKAGIAFLSYTRVAEIPFSSERRMMSVVVEGQGTRMLLAKGAPEVILERSQWLWQAGHRESLSDAARARLESSVTELAGQGYRLLALAQADVPLGDGEAHEADLTFIGLAAISDPPREGARSAIESCLDAGIRVVMITGDAKPTALAVAGEVGLRGEALLGHELDTMTQSEFEQTVERVSVFARAEPRHKVRILEALQAGDRVVVMTGDGVNDAPALKAADVGIAMGIRGTDVARDASDMVLLDDSFPTIVAAIEEGRRIFANIKKFLNYLLIGNFAEVAVVLVAGVFGYLPVTAAQILWINLVTDSGPAVALGVDPAHPGQMLEPPHRGHLISRSMMALLAGTGLGMAAIILGTFALGLALYDLKTAQTMTFTAFVVQEYLRLAVIRYQEKTPFFVNRWLIVAVTVSLLLQIGIVYGPMQDWFGVTPLGGVAWAILLGGLVAGFGLAVVVSKAVVARLGPP